MEIVNEECPFDGALWNWPSVCNEGHGQSRITKPKQGAQSLCREANFGASRSSVPTNFICFILGLI